MLNRRKDRSSSASCIHADLAGMGRNRIAEPESVSATPRRIARTPFPLQALRAHSPLLRFGGEYRVRGVANSESERWGASLGRVMPREIR